MTKQLLIYERATPINPNDHRDVSVKFDGDFGFAREINSAPLMAVEFEPASVEYPIVFVGDASGVMPAALLGIRDNENLYVDESGAWNAKYLPAFIRRYPFVFATDDNERFTLCLDEDFHGVNRKGLGERLFDAEGERTQYLQNVLNFLQAYQAQYETTRAFVQRILDAGLLEPTQAQFSLRTGQTITLAGFLAVNRARLRSLSGDELAKLAGAGDLDLVYAHLASQRNFTPTADRIMRLLDPTPAVPHETAPSWPR
jgi:hypothetical protein